MKQKDSMPTEPAELREPWRWLASLVAGLLTLGVVDGLVYRRLGARPTGGDTVGAVPASGVDFRCRLPVLAGAGIRSTKCSMRGFESWRTASLMCAPQRLGARTLQKGESDGAQDIAARAPTEQERN